MGPHRPVGSRIRSRHLFQEFQAPVRVGLEAGEFACDVVGQHPLGVHLLRLKQRRTVLIGPLIGQGLEVPRQRPAAVLGSAAVLAKQGKAQQRLPANRLEMPGRFPRPQPLADGEHVPQDAEVGQGVLFGHVEITGSLERFTVKAAGVVEKSPRRSGVGQMNPGLLRPQTFGVTLQNLAPKLLRRRSTGRHVLAACLARLQTFRKPRTHHPATWTTRVTVDEILICFNPLDRPCGGRLRQQPIANLVQADERQQGEHGARRQHGEQRPGPADVPAVRPADGHHERRRTGRRRHGRHRHQIHHAAKRRRQRLGVAAGRLDEPVNGHGNQAQKNACQLAPQPQRLPRCNPNAQPQRAGKNGRRNHKGRRRRPGPARTDQRNDQHQEPSSALPIHHGRQDRRDRQHRQKSTDEKAVNRSVNHRDGPGRPRAQIQHRPNQQVRRARHQRPQRPGQPTRHEQHQAQVHVGFGHIGPATAGARLVAHVALVEKTSGTVHRGVPASA